MISSQLSPLSPEHSPKTTVPGPRGHWLMGCLPEFRRGMLPFFERCRKEFGTATSFRLANRRIHLLSNPQLIESVLVHQNRAFQKHYATRLLKPTLGNGLLLSEGEFWLRQRRLIQPAFARRFTDHFQHIILKRGQELAANWQANPERDIHQDMTDLTVQIAAEALLGVDVPGDLEAIRESLEILHRDFERRFLSAVNLPTWIPTGTNRTLNKAVKQLHEVVDRIIADRATGSSEGADALSLLIQARDDQGQPMPHRQLRDEVLTLILAGHDTTANALTWALISLARDSQVAADLVTDSTQETARDILLESMRLYPPVYVFGRECVTPCQLGPLSIRRKDTVLLCQWLVHRDPQWFDDPLVFKPSRWQNDFERTLPPYTYFPFGGGPRICIGKELALLEGTSLLDLFGKQFHLQLASGCNPEPWPTVTLRPRDAVQMKVVPRPVS